MNAWSRLALVVICLYAANTAANQGCFCLRDKDDHIWYDCRTFGHGSQPHSQVECRDQDGKDRQVIAQGLSFQRIKQGEGACKLCERSPSPAPDTPRGDGQ